MLENFGGLLIFLQISGKLSKKPSKKDGFKENFKHLELCGIIIICAFLNQPLVFFANLIFVL